MRGEKGGSVLRCLIFLRLRWRRLILFFFHFLRIPLGLLQEVAAHDDYRYNPSIDKGHIMGSADGAG